MTLRRDFVSTLLTGVLLPPAVLRAQPPRAGRAAPAVQHAGDPVLTAEAFGATGDGTADDTRAMQAAFDAAMAQERPLLLRGRRYRLTAPLLVRHAIRVFGEPGATLLKDHLERGLQIAPEPVWTGRVAGATPTTVEVSGIGLSAEQLAGAWIEIGAEERGQRRPIARAVAGTLTLADRLDKVPSAGNPASVVVPLAYLELDGVAVVSAPGKDGLTNIWIQYARQVRVAGSAASGSRVDGLKISMAQGVRVEGGEFRDNGEFGVIVYNSDDVSVSGVHCSGNRGDYNIEVKDCRNALASGCVTAGGDRGVALYASGVNPTHNCQITSCVSRDGGNAGFQATSQTHEGTTFGADGYAIRDCSAWGHSPGFAVGEMGSQRMAVSVDACSSFAALGNGFNINARFTQVRGCRSERSGAAGFRVQKDGCLLDGCSSLDDQWQADAPGPAVEVRRGVRQTTVRGLVVQRTSGASHLVQPLAEEAGADETAVESLRVMDSEGHLPAGPALVGAHSRGPAARP